jgi:hypothetical protein
MQYWMVYENGFVGTKFQMARGEGLPMHGHVKENAHTVNVVAGSCIVYGPNKSWLKTLNAGDLYDFADDEQVHEIAAIQDDTVIINMIKEPFVGESNWGPDDLYGETKATLTIPLE